MGFGELLLIWVFRIRVKFHGSVFALSLLNGGKVISELYDLGKILGAVDHDDFEMKGGNMIYISCRY